MSAKAINVRPIAAADARAFVRANHYSGKVANNSQLHLGAFIGARLVGVAQFGPPMDRSKLIGLVRDTPWNDMLELNRLALIEDTPRNTESRFLSVCFRLIRRHAPNVQWIVSFADATQCGDGTIYRAAGFVLTGIQANKTIWRLPDGMVFAGPSLTGLGPNGGERVRIEIEKRTGVYVGSDGSAGMAALREKGARPLPGFQLRYVYFLDPSARERLTVPIIPFSRILEMGAGMYKGEQRAGSIEVDAPAVLAGEGGAVPTPALQKTKAAARG